MNMRRGNFSITVILVLQVFLTPVRNQNVHILHDPKIQWEVLHTSHFVIHYPRDHYFAAELVAQVSEELYYPVCESLNNYPETTNIVLRSRIDYPNGFTANIPWRIEINLTEPSGDEFTLNNSWLGILLTHEFTHIVQMRKNRRLTTLAGLISGEYGSILQQLVPTWFTEGLATFNETRFTAGGRGRSEAFSMLLKGALLGHPPWTVSNINYTSRKRKPTENMMYVSGYRIVEFLEKTYGDEILTMIMDDYSSNPIFGLYHVIERHTGLGRKELYQAAIHSISHPNQKIIQPQDFSIRAALDPLDDMSNPRWINDRKLSYYRRGVADPQEINSLDADGSQTTIVGTRLTDRHNSFTLNDNTLVTAELFPHPFFGTQIVSDLVGYDLKRGKRVRLTKNQRLFSPDISKTGKDLIAVQSVDNQTKIVQVNMETGNIKPLIQIRDAFLSNPSQSPDGDKIAFVLRDQEGKQNIAIYSRATDQWIMPYKPNDYHDNFPTWTPDSRHVLYSTDEAGVFDIWTVELESGRRWQVTETALGTFSPQVSPNGKTLAVKVYTPAGFRLATTPLDPGLWRPIKQDRSEAFSGTIPGEEQSSKLGADPDNYSRNHYRGFRSALIPNGWIPLVYMDEGRSIAAMYFKGADPLQFHEFSGIIGIDGTNPQLAYDITYSYKKSWPGIGLRVVEKFNHGNNNNNKDLKNWWKPDRFEIGLNFPITIENNVVRSSINSNVKYIYHFSNDRDHSQFQENYWHKNIQLISSYGKYIQAPKDIAPRLGVFISGQIEIPAEFFYQSFDDWHRFGEIVGYLPSIFKHHSISFLMNAQKRYGRAKRTDSASTPYGYKNLPHENLARLQCQYIFPVAYIERSFLIDPVYMNVLGASIFVDAGSGWGRSDRQFSHNRVSYGIDLNLTGFLWYRLPFKAGIGVLFLEDSQNPALKPYIQIGFF